MSLSAEDIVGYRIKQSLRGYKIDDVDGLLDQVADQVERTDAQLVELRERVRVAEEEAASAARTEQALRRTLMAAQETAERVVADAEREAATKLEEAASDAERLRAEARRDADEVLRTAQATARREAAAARARVDEAAARHHEVLEGIATQRDALRSHLECLDELIEAGVPEVPTAAAAPGLVAGELRDVDQLESVSARDDGATADRGAVDDGTAEGGGGEDVDDRDAGDDGDDEHADEVHAIADDGGSGAAREDADVDEAPRGTASARLPAERAGEGLTIRVHDDAGGTSPPLGSEPRGGR